MDHLISLASLCVPTGFTPEMAAGLYGGLFLMGLGGSLMHCGPMCGPLVLAQVGARLENLPLCEAARWRAGLLPGYHLGRLITYAGLGAVAGLLTLPDWLTPPLLLMTALLLAALALRLLYPSFLAGMTAGSGRWARLIQPLFRRPRGPKSLLLGGLLGFLPCGLVYAALAVAATTGGGFSGGLAMLTFGIGTVPLLAGIGLAGSHAGRRWQTISRHAAPFLMLLGAGTIAGLAVLRLI